MKRIAGVIVISICLLGMLGCVEKKVLVRTEPAGAPVFIDEKSIGDSPVEQSFDFYGRRLIRVGPMENESGKVTFSETERIVELTAPWYQLFPVDFFFEVLWPGRIVDTHEFVIHLPAAEKAPSATGSEAAEEIVHDAEQYREESLSAVPSD